MKADKVAKAEEAARLAEEAAAKAREAARLAQIAADEAAAVEAEESGKTVTSPEKPRKGEGVSEVASKDDDAPEGDSEAPEPVSAAAETPEDADTAGDDADDDADDAVEAESEAEAGEDEKPATTKATKTRRLNLKKPVEDDEEEDDEDDEPRRARMGGLSTVIAVLAVLVLALGAGTTVLYLKVREQKATEQASKEASFASSRAAQKLSSYDYQTLDADLKAASATTTGKLRTQYDKLAQELRTVAVQQQAVSNTTVMKVGVVSAAPDKVVTLVYANRSSATKNDERQRLPEPLRIKMTMEKKDGRWLASELTVIS
ncbi:hypothetical protein [Actinomadura formosensis]|uniref:hypothetical protein n=1 Tax=Actinomadura formosensis TaxID=60706 RepID=UPI003D8F0EA1